MNNSNFFILLFYIFSDFGYIKLLIQKYIFNVLPKLSILRKYITHMENVHVSRVIFYTVKNRQQRDIHSKQKTKLNRKNEYCEKKKEYLVK